MSEFKWAKRWMYEIYRVIFLHEEGGNYIRVGTKSF
jgi:hypothetical protein